MNRKKIIVILRKNEHFDHFKQILSAEYDLLEVSDKQKASDIIHNDSENIVGLVFEACRAIADEFSFIKVIDQDTRFIQISSIALSLKEDHQEIVKCIDNGISEYITAPFDKDLVLLRIRNAIRSKDSTSFSEIENILKELPSNIYFKDKNARYVFSTHLWHHLKIGDEPNWTIRGKTDIDVRKDRENAIKAYEADLNIIKYDKGTSYVIEENDDGIKEYLELIKMPTHDENGNVTGIIALINDITEKQLLKQELERRSTVDFLTGVMNRRACQERIEIQLKDDRKGTMLMVDVDNFKTINDRFGHATGDEVLTKIASILTENIAEEGFVGRMGGDEFIGFLSDNTDREKACEKAQELIAKIRQGFSDKDYADIISVSIGIAICDDEDSSFEKLYSLADDALYSVKGNNKGSYALA